MTDSANGTPLLEVRHVSKYFGSVIALKDISMQVRATPSLAGNSRHSVSPSRFHRLWATAV